MADLKVYTENSNTRCTLVKQHLDNESVAYDEINISTDPDQRARLIDLAQTQRLVLPYLYVGERVAYKSGDVLTKTKSQIETRIKDIK